MVNRRSASAPQKRQPPAGSQHGQRDFLRAGLIAIVVSLTYWNSLAGPFILDDQLSVVQNQQIRQLWPPSQVLFPERELPTAGRPLANLSLALNYKVGGLEVGGYHAVNIATHLLCALLLFAIVRLTLELPALQAATHHAPANVAFAISILWALHPLNTEAINYVTQRTELMMALFYLLTLYGSVRAAHSRYPGRWQVLAIAACAGGMACKESMVTAPLVVLLYERIFLFDSLENAFRKHWRFYAGLALTWGLLAALLWSGPRIHSAGFSTSVSPWTYLLNQAEMIPRYLGLAIWPKSLVINYGWPLPLTTADVWPWLLVMTTLVALTIFAVARYPRIGFLGAWFFVTLAPTSSLVPIATEVGAERRMYLPLVALVALTVVGASTFRRLKGATAAATLALVSLGLAWGTVSRNREYRSPVMLARTTLDRYPTSDAHHWLGAELAAAGRRDEALSHLRQAVSGAPRAHYTLGLELIRAGQTEQAIHELEEFLRKQPQLLEAVSAREFLGRAYADRQRWSDAIDQYRLLLTMKPSLEQFLTAHRLWGDALLAQDSCAEASSHYTEVVKRRPDDVEALHRLGVCAIVTERLDEGVRLLQRVLELAPNNGEAHRDLALALFDQRDAEGAWPHARQAVTLNPADPAAHDVLGRVLTVQGRLADARAEFERALQIDPGYSQAREDLERIRGLGSAGHAAAQAPR